MEIEPFENSKIEILIWQGQVELKLMMRPVTLDREAGQKMKELKGLCKGGNSGDKSNKPPYREEGKFKKSRDNNME